MADPILAVTGLSKTYYQGHKALDVLKSIDLRVQPGEVVSLLGQSGSGKSTFLHCLGLLDVADAGEIIIDGQPCQNLSDVMRTRIRREKLGFVYQFHHLQPEFSALENVMMPQIIAGKKKSIAEGLAVDLLDNLGLSERLYHRPSDLSGGEQQRVAIARALINQPKLLLADEPTGNLDPDTAERIFNLLLEAAKNQDTAILIATHNMELAQRSQQIFKLDHGVLNKI